VFAIAISITDLCPFGNNDSVTYDSLRDRDFVGFDKEADCYLLV
jgi:hypothetical protein